MLNTSRPSDEQAKVAVVRAMYEAYVNNDRAAIEPLLADAFHFTSPLDNRIDRAMYFERCWPNSEHVEGFDFVAVVPAANRVFVVYEARRCAGPTPPPPAGGSGGCASSGGPSCRRAG